MYSFPILEPLLIKDVVLQLFNKNDILGSLANKIYFFSLCIRTLLVQFRGFKNSVNVPFKTQKG